MVSVVVRDMVAWKMELAKRRRRDAHCYDAVYNRVCCAAFGQLYRSIL